MSTTTGEWNKLGFAVAILIIGFALLAFLLQVEVIYIIGGALIAFGVYLLLSSIMKDHKIDQMGTSESGSALWLGSVVTAAGLAVASYGIKNDWMVPVAVFLIAMAVYLIYTVAAKRM